MHRFVVILTGLLVFAYGSVVLAEEAQEKDFLEAAIYGGLSAPVGGINNWQDTLKAKSGFNVGFDIGYFMTANFVLGLTFSYHQFKIDATNEARLMNHRLYNPAVYAKYYFFSASKFAPYLRGQAGVDNPKFATEVLDGSQWKFRELSYDPAFAISGGGGLFYYTSDVSGFYLEANLHHAFAKSVSGTYQNKPYTFGSSSTVLDLHAGLAMYFGSGK